MITNILLIIVAIMILRVLIPFIHMFVILNQSLIEIKMSKFQFINQLSDNSSHGGIGRHKGLNSFW